jgi:hypothetical protein
MKENSCFSLEMIGNHIAPTFTPIVGLLTLQLNNRLGHYGYLFWEKVTTFSPRIK